MKHLLILFFLIVLQHGFVYAQHNTADSTDNRLIIEELEDRSFDQSIIQDFKADSDFVYEQPPETRSNFLRMIFKKLFEWLVLILGNEGVAWIVIIIIVIVGVVGFGFALYGIFGIGKTIPVYNKETDGIEYTIKDENIHELNFSEEIELAVGQEDYRKAVRLVYLYALKLLSNHEVIEWRPYKTNHDYQYEIQNKLFQQKFATLSVYFEYIWYGEFKADLQQFKDMKSAFNVLKSNLLEDVKK